MVRVRVDWLRAECPNHRGAGILPAAINRQVILTGIFRQALSNRPQLPACRQLNFSKSSRFVSLQ